jgi:hypothetical protein
LRADGSPTTAVIGVGPWDFGKSGADLLNDYTTYKFGHPRSAIVQMLANAIPTNRATPRTVKVFDAVASPTDYALSKNIYATGWDGDIVMEADLAGNISLVSISDDAKAHIVPHALPAPSLAASVPPMIARMNAAPPPYDSVVEEAPSAASAQTLRYTAYVQTPSGPRCHRGIFGRWRCR